MALLVLVMPHDLEDVLLVGTVFLFYLLDVFDLGCCQAVGLSVISPDVVLAHSGASLYMVSLSSTHLFLFSLSFVNDH